MLTLSGIKHENNLYNTISCCNEIDLYDKENTLHYIFISYMACSITAAACNFTGVDIKKMFDRFAPHHVKKDDKEYIVSVSRKPVRDGDLNTNILLIPNELNGLYEPLHRHGFIYKHGLKGAEGMNLLEIQELLQGCQLVSSFNENLKITGGIIQ